MIPCVCGGPTEEKYVGPKRSAVLVMRCQKCEYMYPVYGIGDNRQLVLIRRWNEHVLRREKKIS